ncbi:hypothetical protein GA707_19615 [Nostocoides sp. F2B08]|uniref:hypothetical protein n=1 Tax=Nostocoides sp. F2B08 TaxID=2653936 RepID=UPI001263740E|nr:hypothetical protein [Tetrasphaera sp. F2B08]KAB7740362.1 hypothetical protein GA707_19615 [Tetrasphaera sp. F2B08]
MLKASYVAIAGAVGIALLGGCGQQDTPASGVSQFTVTGARVWHYSSSSAALLQMRVTASEDTQLLKVTMGDGSPGIMHDATDATADAEPPENLEDARPAGVDLPFLGEETDKLELPANQEVAIGWPGPSISFSQLPADLGTTSSVTLTTSDGRETTVPVTVVSVDSDE